MRRIDESSRVVRLAVAVKRREELDAVVAPSESAGELRDRHDFKRGDSEVGQLR